MGYSQVTESRVYRFRRACGGRERRSTLTPKEKGTRGDSHNPDRTTKQVLETPRSADCDSDKMIQVELRFAGADTCKDSDQAESGYWRPSGRVCAAGRCGRATNGRKTNKDREIEQRRGYEAKSDRRLQNECRDSNEG